MLKIVDEGLIEQAQLFEHEETRVNQIDVCLGQRVDCADWLKYLTVDVHLVHIDIHHLFYGFIFQASPLVLLLEYIQALNVLKLHEVINFHLLSEFLGLLLQVLLKIYIGLVILFLKNLNLLGVNLLILLQVLLLLQVKLFVVCHVDFHLRLLQKCQIDFFHRESLVLLVVDLEQRVLINLLPLYSLGPIVF